MGKVKIVLCLMLAFALLPLSLSSLQSSLAQSIPKPSVPEFSIKLVDNSYDVPATYSTDPYTGEKVLVEAAHHVDNRTFELWIKNQQYTYSNGSTFHVYYDVKTGGHFGGSVDLYYPSNWLLQPVGEERGPFISPNTPIQSNTDYTVVTLSAVNPPQSGWNVTYPPNAQVDFQVKAMIGHDSQAWGYAHIGGQRVSNPAIAVASESDWSSIQTINLSDGRVTASGSPYPSPTVPELPWLALLPLCLIVLFVALVLKRHKAP